MHSPVPLHFFTQACLGEVWRLERRRSGCYSYQCCLPPGKEEDTAGLQSKTILHKLLPLKVSQGPRSTHGSPFSLALPSGGSVMLGRRNHRLHPMGKEDLAAKLGMGSVSEKILPVPSQTGHLIQRPLMSSWRTYVPCCRRTRGIVHRYLEPFGTPQGIAVTFPGLAGMTRLSGVAREARGVMQHLRWH